MVIIPYVCAEFRDRKGNTVFRITQEMLRTLVDVPEDKWKAMQEDRLLSMLISDGAIKTPETAAERKLLEQEPMLGMNADGTVRKDINPEKPEKPEKPAKAEAKADEKPSGAEQKK